MPKTVEQILTDLREAARSHRIAIARVDAASVALAGEQAHLSNVAKYRANLRAELEKAIEAEVGK